MCPHSKCLCPAVCCRGESSLEQQARLEDYQDYGEGHCQVVVQQMKEAEVRRAGVGTD